ncbi:hypothetical protein [Bordetella hinzii]|uniref:hypothetical protein n=1 Tax=Bordetella hinzii TaxID=103855 RepID=UPI0011873876|nr:hypothetical protein [Bordetella hinzii]
MSFVDFYPTFYPAGSEADWRHFIQAALYKSLVMDYFARFFYAIFYPWRRVPAQYELCKGQRRAHGRDQFESAWHFSNDLIFGKPILRKRLRKLRSRTFNVMRWGDSGKKVGYVRDAGNARGQNSHLHQQDPA